MSQTPVIDLHVRTNANDLGDRSCNISARSLAMFTWGYWGWGNATDKLVEVVDAVERARGFRPPIFVDIRISRSVRAEGFSGDAFRQTVGAARYLWMPDLGNVAVIEHTSGIRIKKPEAAEDLLDVALDAWTRNHRLLFYCSCEFPGVKGHNNACHRTTVAHLVLDAARRRGRSIELVEWPGGEPTAIDLEVDPKVFSKVSSGLKSVPLPPPLQLGTYGALPWCSIANLQSGDRSISVVTGPAKCDSRGWHLPILDGPSAGSETIDSLRGSAERLRRECGFRRLSP